MSSEELLVEAKLPIGDSLAPGTRLLHGIAWGTLIAGTLDISAAIISWLPRGVSPVRILQSVAGGVLGRDTFQGGAASAALGLLLHFLLMSIIVCVYLFASRRSRLLVRHAVACGIAYGVTVFGVMNFIVVPLSAIGGGRPALVDSLLQVGIHIVCVGLPIALTARRFSPGGDAPNNRSGGSPGWDLTAPRAPHC